MDRGAWWATVHSFAQSWSQMKQLSMQYAGAILGFLGGAVIKNPPANAGDAEDMG